MGIWARHLEPRISVGDVDARSHITLDWMCPLVTHVRTIVTEQSAANVSKNLNLMPVTRTVALALFVTKFHTTKVNETSSLQRQQERLELCKLANLKLAIQAPNKHWQV